LQYEFFYLPPVRQDVNDGVLQQLLKIENGSSRHSFAGQQSGQIHHQVNKRETLAAQNARCGECVNPL